MEKINFQDLPSEETPINANNLNQMQDNIEKGIHLAVYSGGAIDPNTTLEYLILTKHANVPDEKSFYYIQTLFYASISTESNRCQIAIGYNTLETFQRYYSNGVWSNWEPIGYTEIITGQECATNEYLDGMRVFTKRLAVTTAISGGTRLTVPHKITGANNVWVDSSKSYVQNRDDGTTIMLPIVYYGNQLNSMQITTDLTNIYIDASGGWNTRWRKVITLKYTK